MNFCDESGAYESEASVMVADSFPHGSTHCLVRESILKRRNNHEGD